MTKKDFYNGTVKLYKQTGQGAPGFIRTKVDNKIIDDLIEEGLLKSVRDTQINHEWICITKGYCVEEDSERSALMFMRLYLGKKDLGLGITPEKVKDNTDFMEKYELWLQKNKDRLEEMNLIEEI